MQNNPKWQRELEKIATVKFRPVIRFGASIRLPEAGQFHFEPLFQSNPEEFLRRWLDGAVSTIYTGPLVNVSGEYSGNLLVVPKIAVRYFPHEEKGF